MPTVQLARCAVHINGQEASYLRTGHGSHIILLRERPDTEDVDTVMAALSAHYRITMPTLPPGDRLDWLGAFMDGIGLLTSHLLAADGWVVPAIAFALAEPDRVDSLAIIGTGVVGQPAGLLDRLEGTGHPLFVGYGTTYNDERSGSHAGASMADALVHFFSGAARGPE